MNTRSRTDHSTGARQSYPERIGAQASRIGSSVLGRSRSALALCLAVKIIGSAAGTAEASTGAATRMSCAVKDADPSLVSHPIPETPEIARQVAMLGDVTIRIALSPRGELERADVFKSSGSAMLDREALRVVRGSTFAPGRAACSPISTESLYVVTFDNEE